MILGWWLNQTHNNYRSLHYKYGDKWEHASTVINSNQGGNLNPTNDNSHFHNGVGGNR